MTRVQRGGVETRRKLRDTPGEYGSDRIGTASPDHMISIARNRALAANNRLVLVAGFGGLLLLMAFAEFDGIEGLWRIQQSNDEIREDFLLRTRVLDRIRDDVYVSGTYVRDYLLEPQSGLAEGHRSSLLEDRNDMDAALSQYRALLNTRESAPF